jgi:hypothetical protein
MRKYNDYENIVYGYLKHYNQFKGQAANIGIEIQGIHEQINSLCDARIAKYGDTPAGGFDELSPAERIIVRKQKLEDELPILTANRQRIENIIMRVDNAMSTLPEVDREIVRMKFIDGYRWMRISEDMKYSERNCQSKARRSVQELTKILFPKSMVAEQGTLDFVFVDN